MSILKNNNIKTSVFGGNNVWKCTVDQNKEIEKVFNDLAIANREAQEKFEKTIKEIAYKEEITTNEKNKIYDERENYILSKYRAWVDSGCGKE